jgi:3-oxoacyl-[acyl-carrier protein] reductase
MDLGLAGKVAAITGGSRGIGRAVALSLAQEGCDVAICARTTSDINQTVKDLQALGVRAAGYTIDVTTPGQVEHFIDEAATDLEGLDRLVANVGATVGGTLLDSTPEDWAQTFELNVFHATRAIRAAVPHMRERDGSAIAIVASISGWKPSPKAQYGAAKAAEIYVAMALARELAPDHIRINTVSPGSILIPGGGWDLYREREPERFQQFEQCDFPAHRLGTAEESPTSSHSSYRIAQAGSTAPTSVLMAPKTDPAPRPGSRRADNLITRRRDPGRHICRVC